nr:hypothetical protein [Tanacetum cinerariifolium]
MLKRVDDYVRSEEAFCNTELPKGVVYQDLYLGVKALVKRENVGFDLTKSDLYHSFVKDLTAKGVGLRCDTKTSGDKFPDKIHENPFFQRLGRYSTNVRVFRDPILFLAGLKTSWEHGQQRLAIIDGENGTSCMWRLMKTSLSSPRNLLLTLEKLVIHSGSVAARIKDRNGRTRGGSSKPPVKR